MHGPIAGFSRTFRDASDRSIQSRGRSRCVSAGSNESPLGEVLDCRPKVGGEYSDQLIRLAGATDMTSVAEIIHQREVEIMTLWAREARASASARGLSAIALENVMPMYLSALADQVEQVEAAVVQRHRPLAAGVGDGDLQAQRGAELALERDNVRVDGLRHAGARDIRASSRLD